MSPQRRIGAEARTPFRWVTLDAGAVIVTDASRGFHFRVPLSEACVLEPPLNGAQGQAILYRIEQPVAGGLAVTLGSTWTTRGSAIVSTSASAVSYLSAVCGPDLAWEINGVPDLSSIYDPLGTGATAAAAAIAASAYIAKAQGMVPLVAGEATVNDSGVTAGSRFIIVRQLPGAAAGHLSIDSRVNGTSFHILSTNAGDDGTVFWQRFQP